MRAGRESKDSFERVDIQSVNGLLGAHTLHVRIKLDNDEQINSSTARYLSPSDSAACSTIPAKNYAAHDPFMQMRFAQCNPLQIDSTGQV